MGQVKSSLAIQNLHGGRTLSLPPLNALSALNVASSQRWYKGALHLDIVCRVLLTRVYSQALFSLTFDFTGLYVGVGLIQSLFPVFFCIHLL
jgi:hypothetical protein